MTLNNTYESLLFEISVCRIYYYDTVKKMQTALKQDRQYNVEE